MDSMRSVDKPITFRSLAENPAVQKPALGRLFTNEYVRLTNISIYLVQIGSKSLIIGEKLSINLQVKRIDSKI